MSLDQSRYDVAIFSTGLTQSILSAALASAGLSVIHVDRNDYYADQWASLTLSELLRWARDTKTKASKGPKPRQYIDNVMLGFPSASDAGEPRSGEPSELPESLASLDRHYAISLAPTLLPATGPSIDCLVSSKVSSYATFRLLERTCIATVSPDSTSKTILASVPASKEDIFKTKTLPLIAKRKLMKLLMYIGTEDWQSDFVQNPDLAQMPFAEYLAKTHKLPPDLVDAVAYGVCLGATPNETTEVAMARAKSHIQSVGRYGNSAYLVGQYGGAGELAQGYCRASAVKGGVFILAHPVKSAKRQEGRDTWEIEVDGIDTTVTADYLVSSDEMLQELSIHGNPSGGSTTSECKRSVVLHRAVLVLDKPIRFPASSSKESSTDNTHTENAGAESSNSILTELPPETGLVVFPPGSIGANANTVIVLMMGEGTFSCPKGQYVYYLQTEAPEAEAQRSAQEVLEPVLDQITALTNESNPPRKPTQRLFELTYRQHVPLSTHEVQHSNLSSIPYPPPSVGQSSLNSQPVTSIAGLTDAAVHLAEKVYYDILASRPASIASGSTHEDKVQWVRQTVEKQKLERKRRKGRDPSEYQGRGGRGADDGITKEQPEQEGEDMAEHSEQAKVLGFFETIAEEQDGSDEDEDS